MGDQQADTVVSNLYGLTQPEELVTRKYDDEEEFEVIKMLWERHMEEMLKLYESPYSYRHFNEEWYNFTKRRAQTITLLGVDNFNYDYDSGFKTYWPQRLREIMKQKWDKKLKIMAKLQKSKGITQIDLYEEVVQQISKDEKISLSPISTNSASTSSKEMNKRDLKLSDLNPSASSINVSGFSKSEIKESSQSPGHSKYSRSLSSKSKSEVDSISSRSSSSLSKSPQRSHRRKRSKHQSNALKKKVKTVQKSSKSSSLSVHYFEQACIRHRSRSLSSCEKESKSRSRSPQIFALSVFKSEERLRSQSRSRESSSSSSRLRYSLRERSISQSRYHYSSSRRSRERSLSSRHHRSRRRSRERRSTSRSRWHYSSRKNLRKRSPSPSRRRYSSKKRSREKKRSHKTLRRESESTTYWERTSSRSLLRQRSRSNSLLRQTSLKKVAKQRSCSRERSRLKSNSSQSSKSKDSLNSRSLEKDFKTESELEGMLKCKTDSRDDSKSSATPSILTDEKRKPSEVEKDCGIPSKNTKQSNKCKFQIPLEDIMPENIDDPEAHFLTAKEKLESVTIDETNDSKIDDKTTTNSNPTLNLETKDMPKPLTKEESLGHSTIKTDATSLKLLNILLNISHQLDPIKSELGFLASAFDALLEKMKNVLSDDKPMHYLAKDSRLALELIHEKLRLVCFSSTASINRDMKLVNEIQNVLNFDSLFQQETNFCRMYGMDIKQLAKVAEDHSPTEIRTFIQCALNYNGMTMIDTPQVDEVYNMMIKRRKLWNTNDPHSMCS